MASGTINRPTLPRGDEVKYLGYSDYTRVKCFASVTAATRYFVFTTQMKSGMIIISHDDPTLCGCYMFGSSGSGSISLSAKKAITKSGWSVTASSNYIKIVCGTNSSVWFMVIMWRGNLPTFTTTQPT